MNKEQKLLKLAENLKETLWEIKKEIQHHKDFGEVFFWENDLIEKIDNAIEYYVNEVSEND